jgi:hypothetical protein
MITVFGRKWGQIEHRPYPSGDCGGPADGGSQRRAPRSWLHPSHGTSPCVSRWRRPPLVDHCHPPGTPPLLSAVRNRSCKNDRCDKSQK